MPNTEEIKEEKGNSLLEKTKLAILNAIDENGNGEIDIEDVIIKGLRFPGVKIDRAKFLQKEFFKRYPQEVIDDAIAFNPAHANIPLEEIDKIADEVIQFERVCVSGISTALSIPGGVALVATIPADIAQYYGYTLRAAQKLLYLYGFPEIDLEEKEQQFDSGTMNMLIVCLGAMFGVAEATNAIKAVASALGKGVGKQLLKAPLTKSAIYPFIKTTLNKWFAVKINKTIFAKFFEKAIPIVGGIIGGGITFLSFKPSCDKLKNSLRDTILTKTNEEKKED